MVGNLFRPIRSRRVYPSCQAKLRDVLLGGGSISDIAQAQCQQCQQHYNIVSKLTLLINVCTHRTYMHVCLICVHICAWAYVRVCVRLLFELLEHYYMSDIKVRFKSTTQQRNTVLILF